MKKSDQGKGVYLEHIRECLARIADYIRGSHDEFLADTKTQDAVLSTPQTMAESPPDLSDALKAAHPEIAWRQMAGFRSVLTHDYRGISLQVRAPFSVSQRMHVGATAGLGCLLLLWAAPGIAQSGIARRLLYADSASTSPHQQFFPGAYSASSDGRSIAGLCIRDGDRWVQVGGPANPWPDCPDSQAGGPPPESERAKFGPFVLDVPARFVLDLGVDNARWAAAKAGLTRTDVPNTNKLKQIAAAYDISDMKDSPGTTEWRLDSARLPAELKHEVPGAGIATQFGELFSPGRAPKPFPSAGDRLLIQTDLALPTNDITGAATSTITVGVNFAAPDMSGVYRSVQLIVGLYSSRGAGPEAFGTDGRNLYARSSLGDARDRFISTVAGRETVGDTRWSTSDRFSFSIGAKEMLALITAFNRRSQNSGLPALKADLSLVQLRGVTLRNENRFMDRGSVRDVLRVKSLEALQVQS